MAAGSIHTHILSREGLGGCELCVQTVVGCQTRGAVGVNKVKNHRQQLRPIQAASHRHFRLMSDCLSIPSDRRVYTNNNNAIGPSSTPNRWIRFPWRVVRCLKLQCLTSLYVWQEVLSIIQTKFQKINSANTPRNLLLQSFYLVINQSSWDHFSGWKFTRNAPVG